MDVEWLQARKRELKITDAALAGALGVERSVANRVANGKVTLNVRRADAVSKLFQVSRDELLFRAGLGSAPPRQPDQPPVMLVDAGETVEITQLDLSFSMGNGTTIDDYLEETSVRFDLSYVRGFTRADTDMLRLARGVGESMFPTLVSSDLVWIDTTQRVLNQQDRIWAISLYGAAAIKRLRRIGGGRVLVMSDNPAVPDQEVEADEVVIGGRVIRFARDL